eukprot:scaffold7918_cov136-Isochrysis_galbana.AAC.7
MVREMGKTTCIGCGACACIGAGHSGDHGTSSAAGRTQPTGKAKQGNRSHHSSAFPSGTGWLWQGGGNHPLRQPRVGMRKRKSEGNGRRRLAATPPDVREAVVAVSARQLLMSCSNAPAAMLAAEGKRREA